MNTADDKARYGKFIPDNHFVSTSASSTTQDGLKDGLRQSCAELYTSLINLLRFAVTMQSKIIR